MESNSNFKNYLIISPKYFRICIFHESKKKIVYDIKILIDHPNDQIDYVKLDNFLENNVFKIENELNFLLKDIILVIENDLFFKLQISVKKNHHGNKISNDDLNYLLNEAKSQTKKSLEDMRVSHMFIENYQIDKNNYNFFPENYKSNNFSLDVCFIGVPNHIIKEFERVLKKYQIFLTGIISSNYIFSLYPDDNQNITKFIDRLQEGTSKNEVVLRPKNSRKSGLFEKFFHLFS